MAGTSLRNAPQIPATKRTKTRVATNSATPAPVPTAAATAGETFGDKETRPVARAAAPHAASTTARLVHTRTRPDETRVQAAASATAPITAIATIMPSEGTEP